MPRRIKKEKIMHVKAFDFYYWLGDARGLQEVATHFKKTYQCVSIWCNSFNWHARIDALDDKVKKKLTAIQERDVMKIRTRQLEMAQKTQERYRQRLENKDDRQKTGVTQYEPIGVDAIRAARHELLLTGQATDRTEHMVGATTIETIITTIVAAIRRILPDVCPHCKTALSLKEKIGKVLLDLSDGMAKAQDAARTKTTAAVGTQDAEGD